MVLCRFHDKKLYGQCHGYGVVTLTWSLKKHTIFSVLEQAFLGIGRGFTLLGIKREMSIRIKQPLKSVANLEKSISLILSGLDE